MCSLNTALRKCCHQIMSYLLKSENNQFMLCTLTSLSLVDRITHKGTEVLWKGMTATAEMVVMEPIMGVVFWYRPLVCIWVDTVHFCRWVSWWLWRRMGGWWGSSQVQDLFIRTLCSCISHCTLFTQLPCLILIVFINVCEIKDFDFGKHKLYKTKKH